MVAGTPPHLEALVCSPSPHLPSCKLAQHQLAPRGLATLRAPVPRAPPLLKHTRTNPKAIQSHCRSSSSLQFAPSPGCVVVGTQQF